MEFNFFNSTLPYENSKHRENFNTIRDYYKWLNSNRLTTINKEEKSFSELRLANYLTLLEFHTNMKLSTKLKTSITLILK